MYRTSSPSLFDIPTLRRVKPLPKRRRTSLNTNGNHNVKDTSQLLQQGSHTAYVSSAYHSRMHPPSLPPLPPGRDSSNPSHVNIPAMTGATDTLPSSMDTFHPRAERRIHPDIYHIPDDILKVATIVKTSSTPGIDDDGSDDHDDSKYLSVEDHQSHHQGVATAPLPSNESTEDEEDSQTPPLPLQHSQYRPSFVRSQLKEPNGDEELDLEGTEGDLQERLFLRAETDRLLAHADSLSARMALQSYYRSMGYGTPEFSSSVGTSPIPTPVPTSRLLDNPAKEYVHTPPPTTTLVSENAIGTIGDNMAAGDEYIAVGVGRGQMDDGDGDGRGDYTDHSSQQGQGNTKKRKVPANVGSSPPHHYHPHPHSYHYPSHRGGFGVGSREGSEVDGEFSFRFGFELERPSMMEGIGVGGEDVFGSTGSHHSPAEGQLPPRQFHRKAKLSHVTLAGLQRKELIRSRKKQLEAIMGTLPSGDTWALDYALSANFPPLLSSFSSAGSSPSHSPVVDSDRGVPGAVGGRSGESGGNWEVGWGQNEKGVKVRLSKRQRMRVARGARLGLERLGRHPDAAPFPTAKFEFSYHSAIADRSITIQEEVASLRNLFGVELAKQTAKAAKVAAKSGKGAGAGAGGSAGKVRKKRAQQRARISTNTKSGEQQAEFLEMPQKGENSPTQPQTAQQGAPGENQTVNQVPTPKKGKKKKRSTLANASNPHHLRNYVPSRLPHAAGGAGSIGGVHGQTNQAGNISLFWPVALRFLSAQLPPRRRKGMNGGGQNGISMHQLVVPQEEWICSFCEYNLFYSDETEYRRAVRNRKKILRRRRRARERAAAAASGVNAVMKNTASQAEKTPVDDEEYDGPGYESVPSNSINVRMDGVGRPRVREAPG